MFAWLRRHLTYANVVSTMCLFVVLGGSVYAASTLSRNSVLSKHIKNGQVKSKDVRDRSLLAKDFVEDQLPAGPRGPQGEQGEPGIQGEPGEPGEPGSAKGYIRVDPTIAIGTPVLNPPRSKGVLAVYRPDTATDTLYCFDLSFDPQVAVGNAFINNNAIIRTAVRADYGAAATTVSGCGAGNYEAAARVADTAGAEHSDVYFGLLFD